MRCIGFVQSTSSLLKPINTISKLAEDVERERPCNSFVTRDIRVKTVSRVVGRVELRVVVWITNDSVKVNDIVKGTAVTDPVVHPVPGGLSLYIGVGLEGGVWATERGYGSGKHRDAEGVDTRNDLFVGLDQTVSDDLLRGWVGGFDSNIVDAFKDHGIFDTRLGEYVSINSADCIRSQTICEDPIATCCLVEDTDVAGGWVLLHASKDEIRPTEGTGVRIRAMWIFPVYSPVIAVRVTSTTIRDAVSYNSE